MGSALRVTELGHVTLFVRDLDASIRFYRDVLGLKDVGRGKGDRLAFFSAGPHHHDLAIEAVRAEAPTHASGVGTRPKGAAGLYHIAFEVGKSLDELAAARRWVEAHGLPPFGEMHTPESASFSIHDPDGHEIEIYVDIRGREGKGDGASR